MKKHVFSLGLWLGLGLFGGPSVHALTPGRTLPQLNVACQQRFPDEPLLNFDHLQDFITRNKVSSARALVASMEGDADFDRFLSSYVLMHTSQSAQSDAVNPHHPRVIMFHRGLILGVTDHPDEDNSNVEVIHYDPDQSKFHFKLVNFSAKDPFDPAPTNCKNCHGNKPNPIWTTYRTWPGAHNNASEYFRIDNPLLAFFDVDTLHERRRELRERIEFAGPATRPQSQRQLAQIDWLLNPVDRPRVGVYAGIRDNSGEGTSLMNEFLNNYNFRRILSELKASPGYAHYRYAMGAALLECPDLESFLGPRGSRVRRAHEREWRGVKHRHLSHQVRVAMESRFQETLRYARQINDPVAQNETAMNDYGDIERIAGLRYLFEKRGVDVKRFSLNFSPGASTYGYGFSRIGGGGGGLRFGLCIFVRDLVQSDPELSPLLALEVVGSETDAEKAPMCRLLKRKSWAALARMP